jgi:hypothetical protein
MRILFPAALAAVIAFTTLVAPASAKKVADEWPASLDCYGKAVAVSSGSNMFAPLVEVRSGKRYKPVAWHVLTDDGRVIDESRRSALPKDAIACGYADDKAHGTVIVKPLP